MRWIKDNAPSIEAIAALITALVAVAALIGVKLQLDANATLYGTCSMEYFDKNDPGSECKIS